MGVKREGGGYRGSAWTLVWTAGEWKPLKNAGLTNAVKNLGKNSGRASLLFLIGCSVLVSARVDAQARTPAATPGAAQATVHHARAHAAGAKPAAVKTAACAPAMADPVLPPGVPAAAGPVGTVFALRYVDVQVGTGELMVPNESLTVHYTGWLASDGTKFDSSVDRGTPFTFQQGEHRVIAGWDQGFAGMRIGGKRRLFIPYQLAYGEAGRPSIPPKSDLIFDIELVAAGAVAPASGAPGER